MPPSHNAHAWRWLKVGSFEDMLEQHDMTADGASLGATDFIELLDVCLGKTVCPE